MTLQARQLPVVFSPAGRSARAIVACFPSRLSHQRFASNPCARPAVTTTHPKPGCKIRARLPARHSVSAHAVDPEHALVSTNPVSELDVDKDLWSVLDLCTDEELELVYDALYGASPFSPVLKTLMAEKEPALVSLRGRSSVMHRIESRFRILAADSTTFLRGRRPSYREALLSIVDRLDVQCSTNLSTTDLELEIFLHTMNNCVEYVQTGDDPDPQKAAEALHMSGDDDGQTTAQQQRPRPKTSWTDRLTAPVKFGMKDMVPTLAKLGSALTVSAVGQRAAQQLGTQLMCQHLRYQAAVKAATSMLGSGVLGTWQRQAALQAAQQGVVAATARYSAVRGVLSFLGPLTWGWLAVDLALKAVGTDYARIIRAVYVLSQVRLVRTYGWWNGETGGPPAPQPQAEPPQPSPQS